MTSMAASRSDNNNSMRLDRAKSDHDVLHHHGVGVGVVVGGLLTSSSVSSPPRDALLIKDGGRGAMTEQTQLIPAAAATSSPREYMVFV